MYFFDTYAVIEMHLANPNYESFSNYPIIISDLNIGEIYLFLVRNYGKSVALELLSGYSFKIASLSSELVIEAADFKFKHKEKRLSWADCIGYVVSRQQNLLFLTGDIQFRGMPDVEFVK